MALTVGATIYTADLDKVLAGLAGRVTDLSPVFHRIDADVSRLLKEQFETRGAALGTPWAPISPVTIRLRTEKRMLSARARTRALSATGADTPLVDSGAMKASFTKPVGPWSLRVLNKLEYVRGSRYAPDGKPVAMWMQGGFRSTHVPVDIGRRLIFVRRKVPKQIAGRPIIPVVLPAPITRAWEGLLATYVAEGAL